jgi:phage terminase large subunit-like protein
MCCITTAAYTTAAFALEEHEYSQRVELDPNMDPARFTFLRNLPKDWDWQVEGEPPSAEHPKGTGWYYANPALGSFLNINNLRAEAEEAKDRPSSQNAFRVFRLNQWTSQANRWLDMGIWDENGRPAIPPATLREKLAGRAAYGGLDLASTSDFTAWVLLFPGSPDDEKADGFTVLPHFFIPRAAVERRAPMQEHFKGWEDAGYITVIEGQTIDYDAIERHIFEDGETFRVRSFGYDQWNATQVVYHLEDAGQLGIKVQQSATRLNDPCKRLESLLADRTFYHGGNPVLRWQADNVELDISGEGLMKPSKAKSGEKIDGIAATLNALFVANVPVEEVPEVTFIRMDDLADDEPGPDRDGLDEFLAAWRGGPIDDDDD